MNCTIYTYIGEATTATDIGGTIKNKHVSEIDTSNGGVSHACF